MENKYATELLSKTISYKYYIDDCNTPVSISISIDEKEPNTSIGQEYHFFVKTSKIANSYSYIIIDYFNLD